MNSYKLDAQGKHWRQRRYETSQYWDDSHEEALDRMGRDAAKLIRDIALMSNCSLEDALEAVACELGVSK